MHLPPQSPILGDLESQNPPNWGGWGAIRATILTFQTASKERELHKTQKLKLWF
jgi:hypothetical protein